MKNIQYTLKHLLILVCISFSDNVLGQDQLLGRNLTVDFSDLPLREALTIIEDSAQVTFSYSSRKIPVSNQVSLAQFDGTLEQGLKQLFQGLGIQYFVLEGKIILKSNQSDVSPSTHTISGYIKDADDGETLIGSTVLVKELIQGAISNAYGFYSITLPEGQYSLKYSFIGYEEQEITVNLVGDINRDIDLTNNVAQLEEVVVSPKDSLAVIENIHTNALAIDHEKVLLKTAAMGETDVIKSLDIIPGIQLFRDGSTFFNVRGGDRDQNQILLDEAPIYNPAHFMGLFSSIMPESIKDMKIYRGDFPAQLGGRLSSVLDIKTRDGNLHQFGASGSIGLISGRMALEGPIKKGKSSYFVSGRRSYIQGLIESADPDFDQLYFSDFTAKANVWINRNNRLFLSTYLGKDKLRTDGGIEWGNKAGTIRWNHIFSDRLFSNTTLYSSKYEYSLVQSSDFIWKNHISNVSLKMDFTHFLNLSNTLRYGMKISGHNFNPGNVEDENGEIPSGQPFVPKRNATEFSVYMSSDQKINNKWLITFGARLSTWTNFGRTIEYNIDENYTVVDSTIYDTRDSYHDVGFFEPRLSITHLLDAKNILKLNYTRSVQYINLISNSISPFNNLEVWMPSGVNIKPQIADQWSVGWFRTGEEWQWSLEAYHKQLQNQLDYINQASILLNPYLETQLRSGKGRAYGFETSLIKKSASWTGSVTYTYSKSLREIPGINNGQEYVSLWDKPHQFALNASWNSSARTTFSGTFYISSGGPITTPTSFYRYSGKTVPLYNSRNNDRLPVYHRYDMSINWRLNKTQRRFNHYLTFSIFNLYAQKNSILLNFNKIEDGDQHVVPLDIQNASPVVSSQVFVYIIVPSISYSFKL